MKGSFQQQKKALMLNPPAVGKRVLQRKCACDESPAMTGACTECSEKQLNVQRPAAEQTPRLAASTLVAEALRSPGQPLDAASRAFMEPRFGHDFSQVRVHEGNTADASARLVNALAYSSGRDIVFQSGKYQPHQRAGQALLAHELTHTIQQQTGEPFLKEAAASSLKESDQAPDDPISRAIAEAATEVPEGLDDGSALQRQPDPDADNTDAFPEVNAELVLDPGQRQRCCTCGTPPCVAHLGAAVPGDPTAQNGVNLVATLLHTIASSSRSLDYGFVQVMQTRRCLEFLAAVGGGWTIVDNQPAGTNDVFGACATCTTPIVRDVLPEIVYADAPGLALAGSQIGARAFGNQLVQRGNFQTWVIARAGRQPWRRISEPVRWHSLSWIRSDAAGNWELNPGHNEIGPGWTRFGGGCPP